MKKTSTLKNSGLLLLCISMLAWIGCKVEADPIHFGHDQCHACKMNIVDRQHASQLVTSKGKQFKFDSIECLSGALESGAFKDVAISRVADFGANRMIDASSAFYLISPQLRSPMGANLSAFANEKDAQEAQKKYGGTLHRWQDLAVALKNTPK